MTRVLVVEDSPTQAEEIRLILESEGFAGEIAPNAQEGLGLLEGSRFELVLSDILMPGLSGYDLCRRIKADPKWRDIPVILLTTLSDPMNIIQGLECGADNFLTKPYEPNYLLGRIKNILDNKRMRAEGKLKVGVEIFFLGKKFTITSDKEQILDLLISTFEDIVRTNSELLASQKTLKALFQIAEGLNRTQSEQEVLETALERAMELPGIQAGWIVLNQEKTGFRVAATRRLPPALQSPGALEGDCLCRRELLTGQLGRATNIYECERLQKAKGDTAGLKWHASAPLRSGDRILGLINLAGPGNGLFSEESLKVLGGVGNEIAVAIERARLQEQLRGELRVSEEKYGHLMEHANDAIFILDTQGKVLQVNRQAETLLGLPGTEIIGRLYNDFADPEDLDTAVAEFGKVTVHGSVVTQDIHLRRLDGKKVCVEFSASLIEIGSEPIVFAIARDVTERNQLEQQYRQAQKMEAVGRLAGGVAHDFNNLLTVILGYSQLLLDRLDAGDPLRQETEEVIKAGKRAATLTGQLLAFSRRQVFQPRVLDLNAAVGEVSKMLRRLIGEDIDLVTLPDPALGHVKADPAQIEQVILNLAVNARDAMPEGGKLTIETANVHLGEDYARQHVEVHPGRYVMLALSDTGHGMDEQTQSHLFEPFFTTKELGKGTGLGLSTVYGIVKQSGGHILVYSEPAKGTSFKIYLPRIEAVVEALSRHEEPGSLPVGTETVLVVEDEPAVRQLALLILRAQGYTVLEATNGEEALRVAQEHGREKIDLLLTDIVMPQMGGKALAEQLRVTRPKIKVLFASGYTDKAIVDHELLSADMPFLQKPFTPGTLARKVRQVLDGELRDRMI